MKRGFNTLLAAALGFSSLPLMAGTEDTSGLKDQKEKISYALGVNIGNNLKRNGFDVDFDVFLGAMKDSMKGTPLKLSEAQVREVLTGYQRELATKREDERKKTAEKNRKDGEAFLATNKQKPGIITKSVALADGTQAEFQYK